MRPLKPILGGGPLVLLAGCSRLPAALAPQGPAAERSAELFWLFAAVSAAVWLLVVIAVGVALARRRTIEERSAALVQLNRWRDAIAARIIAGATAVTAVILILFTAQSYFTGRSLADLAGNDPLTIEVTGRQWWWDVRYENAAPSRVLVTANEIHVPAGDTVLLKLES